jgi:FdrA protein
MHANAIVRKNQYQDSVRLMQISREVSRLDGVGKVLALLGTESNKKILDDFDLVDDQISAATPNDLIICIEAESDTVFQAALAEVDQRLTSVSAGTGAEKVKPRSIEEAAAGLSGTKLAMISLPGQMAKLDVEIALQQGLHVMLFSDNISLEDEIELKKKAVDKGLLLMGPDCGTAILSGVALALANVVRPGDVGLAAASGTGIQEVTSLIDRFGGGVSHAIGVGGRDLRREVGGIMMCQAIRTLRDDPNTKRLVILSKPGAPEIMKKVLEEAKGSGMEVVACILGSSAETAGIDFSGVRLVETLEEAAFAAMGRQIPALDIPEALSAWNAKTDTKRQYLRGLYSGGTLCYETLYILQDEVDIESNVALKKELKLDYPVKGTRHCCVDLGEDEFTQGRPHPIIDLDLRLERLREDMADPTVRVILLDLVLGYGAHADPAPELVAAISAMRSTLPDGGPAILIHVCGTDGDPQNLARQEEILAAQDGVFLLSTNAQAARAALQVLRS